MTRNAWWLGMLFLCAVMVQGPSRADEDTEPAAASPAESAATETAGTADATSQWIRDLDANRFSQRQAASQKLSEAGKPAIPALEQAALGDSREAMTRAIDILGKFYHGSDEETRAAAKEALQRVANGDVEAAARRATEALRPKEDKDAQQLNPGNRIQIFPGGPIQLGQGQIQIQVQAFGNAGARKVRMKNVNGVKDIDVEEANRKIHIHEEPNGPIKVTVTKKEGDKEVKESFEAKNAAELKQKHPAAHKLYEKYGKNQAPNVQLQLQGMQMPPGVVPQLKLQNLLPRAGRGQPDKESREKQIDEASQGLRKAIERLKKLDKDSAKNAPLREAIEQLEQADKKLRTVSE